MTTMLQKMLLVMWIRSIDTDLIIKSSNIIIYGIVSTDFAGQRQPVNFCDDEFCSTMSARARGSLTRNAYACNNYIDLFLKHAK